MKQTLPSEAAVTPVKVAQLPGYSEGIVFDRSGLGFVSDIPNNTIYSLTPEGTTAVWAKAEGPNGHKVLADGTHLVCATGAVVHFDAGGTRLRDASSHCDGTALRAPNDLTIDPRGGFYFTDPGGSTATNAIGTVHYVDPRGVTHLIAKDLAFPNGLVITLDGQRLLLAESYRNHILSYPILAPGALGTPTVFATLPSKQGDQIENAPDGLALDEDGNLYIAHYGMHTVQVLSPSGELLRSYPGGNLTTSNVAFSGPDMDQLYITGALQEEKTSPGGIWRLELKGVRGRKLLH